jgi:threonine synthase
MNVICPECGKKEQLSPQNWHCDCGEPFEPIQPQHFVINSSDPSLWRYYRMFGVDFKVPYVSMGNVCTPLLPVEINNRIVHFKLEYISPTGSFKDRGTAVMINILAHQGAHHVIDDSSGNAGASVAAYGTRAGMKVDIYVPSHASPAKQSQIAIYGVTIHAIPGPRVAAKQAALNASNGNAVLASHAYHPGFLAGQQSVAWEIWEQLGGKIPDWYVVPAGQGVHLLGAWLGFSLLKQVGLTDKIPKMVAVQPKLLAPIRQALDLGLDQVPEVEVKQPSLAEGLAIASPIRGKRILQAIRESNGDCVTVDEEQILFAQGQAAQMGFYIEPTSATVIAALDTVFRMAGKEDCIVVPLTGSGLKGTPKGASQYSVWPDQYTKQ